MTYMRLSALMATAGVAALLSGCVVAPIGPRPVTVYPAGVYVEPVVVVPAPRYYYGYRGYRGYRGHHGHRGSHD